MKLGELRGMGGGGGRKPEPIRCSGIRRSEISDKLGR